MSKISCVFLLLSLLALRECGGLKSAVEPELPVLGGMAGLTRFCEGADTAQSILIKKAEAVLIYDGERYEVSLTLYSKRDSIIYLSAVNSGYEILRASVKHDSIKVIDRINKIVYHSPLERELGYQYPVNFRDLQNLVASYYLCDDLPVAKDDHQTSIVFDFDEDYIKKRVVFDRLGLEMKLFEFYHKRTALYLMGERMNNSFKVYSNFMINDLEIIARGGERSYNRDVNVKMEVNPRKYTFTELR